MKNRVKQFTLPAVVLSALALALTGCQTPPNADVQPSGKPGLIQAGIPVEIIQGPVTVESLDAGKRLITLKDANGSTKTFYLDSSVQNLDQVKIGDSINATVKAEMSVYILQNGRIPNPDGTTRPRTINFNAKVLTVKPGRRQLTLLFTNGRSLTIQAGWDVELEKMTPGDHVVIRSREIITIAVLKA